LSEFGDALAGYDRARLEEYLEEVNLEAVVREGGATASAKCILVTGRLQECLRGCGV